MHNPHHQADHDLGTLIDPELAAILPVIAVPGGEFRHRQHIHLAFWAVRRYGMPAATDRVCDWIRHLAAYQRAPQKYHHTVSRAWMELVAHHVTEDGLSRIAAGARSPGGAEPHNGDFDAFAGRHPALLDKRLLSRHYRSATLASARARQSWVEPDLVPFP
ncbi:MAG: hypothetical protein JO345_10740 [Streptosporangiaceae bacterium]|nr:hypothetical protein [Streptosporangiaceae bacterium]